MLGTKNKKHHQNNADQQRRQTRHTLSKFLNRLNLGFKSCLLFCIGLTGVAGSTTLFAEAVDLELVLLVDISGSISSSEFDLQKQGYTDAFNDSDVIAAIEDTSDGKSGKIAVTLVYWSENQLQAVGWTKIDSAASSIAFGNAVLATSRPVFIGGSTHIGSAINAAFPLFNGNGFEGTRLVIDVSGDGEENGGDDTATARDAALNAGVTTINGIVIGNNSLLEFYEDNVIGGASKFAKQAVDFADFGARIKEKISAEVTATANQISLTPATASSHVGTNHTVTASLSEVGSSDPLANTTVTFTIISGPNTGVSGICSANSNCKTDSRGEVSFTYTGSADPVTGTGTDTIQACFTDPQTSTEKCKIVEKIWVAPPQITAQAISLTPPTATRSEGTQHTVTAALTEGTAALPNTLVTFTVLTGPNAGTTGACTVSISCNTDSSGNVSFIYTGIGGIGTDKIEACFTDQSQVNQCATVNVIWINLPPVISPGPSEGAQATPGTPNIIIDLCEAHTNNQSRQTRTETTPPPVDAEFCHYRFVPIASDPENDHLTYSIQNKPPWATFDKNTGVLSGQPGDSDTGIYSNIIISVTDGNSTVSLAPFQIVANGVNKAPAFHVGADQLVCKNSGGHSVPFVTGQTDSNVETQQLHYVITHNSNANLFGGLLGFGGKPWISASSQRLGFRPALNASGTAEVCVKLTDNGGTAFGGVDESQPQCFHITVDPNCDDGAGELFNPNFPGGSIGTGSTGSANLGLDFDYSFGQSTQQSFNDILSNIGNIPGLGGVSNPTKVAENPENIITFDAYVLNGGPEVAGNVILQMSLSGHDGVIQADPRCTGDNSGYVCYLNQVPVGQTRIQFKVKKTGSDTFGANGEVSADNDSEFRDNSAQVGAAASNSAISSSDTSSSGGGALGWLGLLIMGLARVKLLISKSR